MLRFSSTHKYLGSPLNYVKRARALHPFPAPILQPTPRYKARSNDATRERVLSFSPPRAILAPGPAHPSLDLHAARAPDSFTRSFGIDTLDGGRLRMNCACANSVSSARQIDEGLPQ
ncbi:uncharacterized [Tachysurus ichikawai]